VLSVPVLAGGWVIATAGVGIALRKLDERTIPRTAIFSAVFFVASLIAAPVGPSSVHLLLAGLMGLMIGVRTIPAVMVGLLLQAVLFGFGGLTTLGVNTVNIALPGVLLGMLFGPFVARANATRAGLLAGLCGALSVVLTGGGVALALALSASEFHGRRGADRRIRGQFRQAGEAGGVRRRGIRWPHGGASRCVVSCWLSRCSSSRLGPPTPTASRSSRRSRTG
jgi:cobalt/nickel transport system permease protein